MTHSELATYLSDKLALPSKTVARIVENLPHAHVLPHSWAGISNSRCMLCGLTAEEVAGAPGNKVPCLAFEVRNPGAVK